MRSSARAVAILQLEIFMRIHRASGLFLALAVPAIAPQASHPAVENAKSKSGKVYTD
jgi:hypothetical protein